MWRSTQNPYVTGGTSHAHAGGRVSHHSSRSINAGYIPISSPPTPAPSPLPFMSASSTALGDHGALKDISDPSRFSPDPAAAALAWSSLAPVHLRHLSPSAVNTLLTSTLPYLDSAQLMHLASLVPSRLTRDFVADLPPEIALHILGFVDDVRTLARAGQVSRAWRMLVTDEAPWRSMYVRRGFEVPEDDDAQRQRSLRSGNAERPDTLGSQGLSLDANTGTLASVINLWTSPKGNSGSKGKQRARHANPFYQTPIPAPLPFSYRKHFKTAHLTESNWRHSGRLLRCHRSYDAGVVTSLAMDDQWIVVGLANSRVHVFSSSTGVLARTLMGHEAGVWSLWLVSKGGGTKHQRAESDSSTRSHEDDSWASMIPKSLRAGIGLGDVPPTSSPGSSSSSSSSEDMPFQSVFDSLRPASFEPEGPADGEEDPRARQSDPCNASSGWGQANALVVSGGCDKQIRVWDVKSGYCLYVLRGHRSTIRCIKVFHGRPVAVSGSRDQTLRVWDVQRGILLRTLEGHTDSVRCIDVFGNKVVSGSYDCTVRLWDVDTGECLRVFDGHYHQVYTVAFDGERIASGGLDTTVRIWSASTGTCLALLQGHTALVCQLQLSSRTNTVITGSADGRIIIFSIAPAYAHLQAQAQAVPVASSTQSDPLISPPSSPSGIAVSQGAGRHTDESDASAYRILTRVPAHSLSVTGLQFDERPGRRRVVSGGNDGRVQLWEVDDGSESKSNDINGGNHAQSHGGDVAGRGGGGMRLVRDLTEQCEGVWKVAFRSDLAIICCLRAGRTVLEIWSFRPVEEDL